MTSPITPAGGDARSSRLLYAIIAAAVILRLGSAWYQGNSIEPLPGITDQVSYHELAIRVVGGHGFSFGTGWWPATPANHPTAHWSFLYTLFLAAIYSVTGPAPLVARLLQAVLVGILHPLLAWRLGRRLFNPSVGLVSAALTAFYGYFVYYAGALVTESLYFLAFLWVLDVATALVYLPRNGARLPRLNRWILLGLACGVCALLRQLFVLVVPIILAWIAWRLWVASREAEKPLLARLALGGRLAVTVAVLALCILPWTLRNQRAFGQFVLLNTNAGFVFFWGNHPIHGTNFIPILPDGEYGSLLPQDVRSLNEGAMDRALLLRGLGFIRDDPKRYVLLSISRAKEYFKFWPSSDSSGISNGVRVLSFGLCLPLLFGGIVLTLSGRPRGDWREPSGALLLLAVSAAYAAIHLLTWSLVRYRLPIDAIAMPFAAVCVVALFQRISHLAPIAGPSLRSSTN